MNVLIVLVMALLVLCTLVAFLELIVTHLNLL